MNLKELLASVPDKWMDHLEKKHISLQIAVPAGMEIVSDSFLLELIIDNLLSNAIKYGREGGCVSIQWDEVDNALTIADDGDGIAAEHIPHLFERFYRVDEARNSKVPGYGLGLAIVKRIATLLNIKIGVSSEEGEGTKFILYFSYGFHRII